MSKPKSFDSWTPEKQEEWREKKRAIARKCYEKNADKVKLKVRLYKAKNRKPRQRKICKKGFTQKCQCGSVLVKHWLSEKPEYSSLCKRCSEDIREERRQQFLYDEYISGKSRRVRKWGKFLCDIDRYSPSVRVKGICDPWLYMMGYEPRSVQILTQIHHTITCVDQDQDPYELPKRVRFVLFDGYFRIDQGYHYSPPNGKYGILQLFPKGNSPQRNKFESFFEEGLRIEESFKANRLEKTKKKEPTKQNVAQMIRDRKEMIKRERETSKRMSKNYKRANMFFQMQAVTQAISQYTTAEK